MTPSRMALAAPRHARLVLALASPAPWRLDGRDVVEAPYVDGQGMPLLFVDESVGERVLSAATISTVLRPVASLGSVELVGRGRPVRQIEYLRELAAYRDAHADCAVACGANAAVVVGVELTDVRLTRGHGGRVVAIDPRSFRAAQPDRLLADAYALAAHLNRDHLGELTALATLLVPADRDIVGASIAAIDRHGIVLNVVDRTGGHDLELAFAAPVTSADALSRHLHHLLHDPLGYMRP